MWRLHKIALDAKHELPGGRVNVLRLQPREVFLQHVIGQGREERLQLKERRLLLDNAVDSYVADLEALGHVRTPKSGCSQGLMAGYRVGPYRKRLLRGLA